MADRIQGGRRRLYSAISLAGVKSLVHLSLKAASGGSFMREITKTISSHADGKPADFRLTKLDVLTPEFLYQPAPFTSR